MVLVENAFWDRKLQHEQYISVPFHFKNAEIIACFHPPSGLNGRSLGPLLSSTVLCCHQVTGTRGRGGWHRLRAGLEGREAENYLCFNLAIPSAVRQTL